MLSPIGLKDIVTPPDSYRISSSCCIQDFLNHAILKLTIEDRLILAGVKLNPEDKDIRIIDELVRQISDWDYFIQHAIQHCVGPLLYKNLLLIPNFKRVPDSVTAQLKQTYLKTLSRNMVIYEHFRNAITAFSSQNISVIALKGIFMADTIYRDIGLRQMSDIDLLVGNSKDGEKCKAILLDLGYTYSEIYHTEFNKQFSDSKHLPPLVLNGVSIELHTKINLDNPGYSVNLDDYRDRSQPVILFGTKVQALSPVDLIQHLCIHLDGHFTTSKIQLTSFCDISEVLNFYKNDFDWKSLEDSCNSYHCQKNVYNYIFLAKKYFNAIVPDSFMKQAEQYIDQKHEDLFMHYIQFDTKEIEKNVDGYEIKSINKVQGIKNKVIYVFGAVFPDRSFMYERYRIKNKPLIYWYYWVRIRKAMYAIFIYLRNRLIKADVV